MKMTLKLIAAMLIASVAIAGAADDDAKKKDKPAKKAGGLMTADKDKDGKITLDEFKAWGAAKSKPIAAEKAESIFKKRDKNSDGAITKDELGGGGKKKGADGAGKKKKKNEAK